MNRIVDGQGRIAAALSVRKQREAVNRWLLIGTIASALIALTIATIWYYSTWAW